MRWTVLSDPEAVANAACQAIQAAAAKAIKQRGVFRIVMAGGTTPERAYGLLSQRKSDWTHWQVFWGDERCLPVEHPDRNSMMVKKSLTDHVPIAGENIFPIPAELGPEQAAQQYETTILSALPFDLVLLGMGEDGHTASLFPGEQYSGEKLVAPVFNAPKLPSERVSLTPYALKQSRQLLMLITGDSKRAAVEQWLSGEDLPVSQISCQGDMEILADRGAYPD